VAVPGTDIQVKPGTRPGADNPAKPGEAAQPGETVRPGEQAKPGEAAKPGEQAGGGAGSVTAPTDVIRPGDQATAGTRDVILGAYAFPGSAGNTYVLGRGLANVQSHVRAPPAPGVKERKARWVSSANSLSFTRMVVNPYTEFLEGVDCAFKALPKKVQWQAKKDSWNAQRRAKEAVKDAPKVENLGPNRPGYVEGGKGDPTTTGDKHRVSTSKFSKRPVGARRVSSRRDKHVPLSSTTGIQRNAPSIDLGDYIPGWEGQSISLPGTVSDKVTRQFNDLKGDYMKPLTPTEKLETVYRNINAMNMDAFMKCMTENEIEDRIIGAVGQ
jgi:hypothetical protein